VHDRLRFRDRPQGFDLRSAGQVSGICGEEAVERFRMQALSPRFSRNHEEGVLSFPAQLFRCECVWVVGCASIGFLQPRRATESAIP
jgi:hypothetical protein